MTTALRPGDVLRGMELEPEGLRIGRIRVVRTDRPASASPAAERQVNAELLQEQVDSEVRRLRAEAERQGYEAGLREGRAMAEKQAESALQEASAQAQAILAEEREKLRALASGLGAALSQLQLAAEDDMVALCFETLCRVLGEGVPSEEAIRCQLRAATPQIPPGAQIAVHVHPADAELLAVGMPADTGGLRWIADPEVALGGCVVRHAGGGLDLRFETALAACRDTLSAQRQRRLHSRVQP